MMELCLRRSTQSTVRARELRESVARAASDTDVGFAGWGPRVGVSVDPDQVFFVEAKVSVNDVPDLKVSIGWPFYP